MRTVARSLVPRVLVVGLLGVLCGAGLLATQAHAEDRTVEVRFDGYAPAEVTVGVGDTVTWVWETGGHSVTHQPEEGQERAFDSHPDCDDGLEAWRCGGRGDEFSHQFQQAGTYRYVSRMDEEFRGTVVVESEPTSSPTPSPSPTPTGLPSPTEDPEPTESPDPSSEPESDDPESDESTSSGSTSDGDAETSDPRQSSSQQLSSDTSQEPQAATPEVATPTASDGTVIPVEEPSFDAFPEGSEPSVEDVPGEVVIGESDGDDTSRLVWGVLGGVTLLGTIGAFSRTVLFGEDWPAGS